ncbi:Ca2+-transporting ATPase [Luteibacter sp. UNC138MFCol5.1]|uniref:cation-translocating P-type ATPase n=1 Tax=Luteibacter sp. UNC138MFCol5.1 TaxID=1502774 RepID=UPI0008B87335|nr:cation-translocating P-type ATPase [Luteibacter sp. UNC138MFCol5.1]SEO31962.1 Ca2+-transporting ATPase [Luteibacter sp. UNC138MFCol5.1]
MAAAQHDDRSGRNPPERRGLDDAEARRLLAQDGPNDLPEGAGGRCSAVLLGIVGEPMFLLLILAATVYAWLGDAAEAIFLGASVALVVAISAVQEWRARSALAALRRLAAPSARVLRSGVLRTIPAREVVRGDVLLLSEGERVIADGALLEGHVLVDESLLTGESIPVEHEPGQRGPPLRAGTLVLAGSGWMETTATGTRTMLGGIGTSLADARTVASALQRAASRIVRFFAIIALFLAAGVAVGSWWWAGRPPSEAALSGIALAMAMLPEEIPVILVVFYALGAHRIARRAVLTRRLAAVETLGAISLLAVDKTGTLTCNRMSVVAVASADGVVNATGAAPRDLVATLIDATPPRSIDPTDEAIARFARDRLDRQGTAVPAHAPAREFPVAEHRPFTARVFGVPGGGRWTSVVKGAPEAVLRLCDADEHHRDRIGELAASMASRGQRVLAVATATVCSPRLPDDPSVATYRLAGLVALADPLRDEVPSAIRECAQAGIRVVMLTGDHAATACSIAAQAGLRPGSILTGDDIDAMDDAQLARRMRDVDVCARVRPTQKLRLVRALQRAGHVVGMTGDGVNDAPALRAADVGIAMGRRGSDVARDAADIVLLDDRFAALVEGIRSGRRIFDNVRHAMRFVAAAHVPVLALTVVPLILRWPPLLLPVQIALLEMVIDPACSVVFEAMPERAGIMRRPPRRASDSPFGWRNVSTGMLQGVGASAALVAGHGMALAAGVAPSTAALSSFLGILAVTLLLVMAGARVRHPSRSPWLAVLALVTGLIGAAVCGIPSLRALLGFGPPTLATVAQVGGVLTLTAGWLVAMHRVVALAFGTAPARNHTGYATVAGFHRNERRPRHEDPDCCRR